MLALADRLGADWPFIAASREQSSRMAERITRELLHLVPPETTLVVSGSLARCERTAGGIRARWPRVGCDPERPGEYLPEPPSRRGSDEPGGIQVAGPPEGGP